MHYRRQRRDSGRAVPFLHSPSRYTGVLFDMTTETDDQFYARADAHIHTANEQLDGDNRGKVSASMMYATARFNAWISACTSETGDELQSAKPDIVEYFVGQYREMLEEHLDDYVRNFDKYMKS